MSSPQGLAAERFVLGPWHVIAWEEGGAAYHRHTGDTHALDPLTAEVLRLGGSVTEHDAPTLARRIAEHLDIPCDPALEQAVAQSLQRLSDLDHA